jgi:hypothetical protein
MELKSCPFCGKFPKIKQWEDGDNPDFDFSVDCDCGINTIWFDKLEEAIKFWNARVEPKSEEELDIEFHKQHMELYKGFYKANHKHVEL